MLPSDRLTTLFREIGAQAKARSAIAIRGHDQNGPAPDLKAKS